MRSRGPTVASIEFFQRGYACALFHIAYMKAYRWDELTGRHGSYHVYKFCPLLSI